MVMKAGAHRSGQGMVYKASAHQDGVGYLSLCGQMFLSVFPVCVDFACQRAALLMDKH